MSEASHSVPQRLPDRREPAGVSHHVRFVLSSRPDHAADLASVISGCQSFVRAVQAAADEDLTWSAPALELGQRRLVELPLAGRVAQPPPAPCRPGWKRPGPRRRCAAPRTSRAGPRAQQQVSAILLVPARRWIPARRAWVARVAARNASGGILRLVGFAEHDRQVGVRRSGRAKPAPATSATSSRQPWSAPRGTASRCRQPVSTARRAAARRSSRRPRSR